MLPIAKRLDAFIQDHAEYSDTGDSENGPNVEVEYIVPLWVERIISIADGEYELFLFMENMFIEGEEIA